MYNTSISGVKSSWTPLHPVLVTLEKIAVCREEKVMWHLVPFRGHGPSCHEKMRIGIGSCGRCGLEIVSSCRTACLFVSVCLSPPLVNVSNAKSQRAKI